jgi:DNA-binding MurR/RpiR family transcriptional regulator
MQPVPSRDEPDATVADRIRMRQGQLSRAEQKIVRVLLANYPAAGLQSSHSLAVLAGVSSPTVLRFLASLGFAKYADFQSTLRGELQERSISPLTMRPSVDGSSSSGQLLASAMKIAEEAVHRTFTSVSTLEFDRAVQLLSDTKLPLTACGGRFSHTLAIYVERHLRLLRKGARTLEISPEETQSFLLDVTRRDVLLAFDFRRYSREVVELVSAAKARGAQVIVVTDPWLSPAATHADVVLTARVEGATMFDSIAPAVALMETLMSAVQLNLGDAVAQRIRTLDQGLTEHVIQ